VTSVNKNTTSSESKRTLSDKTMNILSRHRIATMVAATSIASLLVTATTQGQAKAVVLNYQGTDYDFTVVNELGTSANLTQNFWWNPSTVLNLPSQQVFDLAAFLRTNSAFLPYISSPGSYAEIAAQSSGSTVGVQYIDAGQTFSSFVPANSNFNYVVATAVPAEATSVPEPSDILGTLFASLVAGYGVRARRKPDAK
jgi:hypothetical protein